MRRGRAWFAAFGASVAIACSLPSVDEYARPPAAAAGSTLDAGDADAAATSSDAATNAPYLRLDPPVPMEDGGVNLSASGSLDWVMWQDPIQRCARCAPRIGTLATASTIYPYGDDLRTFTWTGGAPDATGTSHTGVFLNERNGSFELPILLPDTPALLTFHADVYNSAARLDATLDGVDAGPPPSVSVPVGRSFLFLTVHAFAPGHTLRLTWTMTGRADGDANIAVAAVTLAPE